MSAKSRPRDRILNGNANGARRRYAKIADAAEYIAVNPATIDVMLRDGRLTRYSLGPRVIRVDLNEIDAAMEAGGVV